MDGNDHRLLCVDGKFVAATERRAASVTGDGESTIAQLIDRENARSARLDTPTSPLGKVVIDESMERFLSEQKLDLESVIERDRTVYLRKSRELIFWRSELRCDSASSPRQHHSGSRYCSAFSASLSGDRCADS